MDINDATHALHTFDRLDDEQVKEIVNLLRGQDNLLVTQGMELTRMRNEVERLNRILDRLCADIAADEDCPLDSTGVRKCIESELAEK